MKATFKGTLLSGLALCVFLLGGSAEGGGREVDPDAADKSGQGRSQRGPLPVSRTGLMRVVGRLDSLTNGNACGVASKGHYVYLALNESHEVVQVYDLREPTRPRKIGYIPAAGWPKEVKVFGDVGATFSPSRYNAISAVDFSDPARPKVLKSLDAVPMLRTPREQFSCQRLTDSAVQGHLLFTPGPQGMHIWDIADARKPAALGVARSRGKFVVDGRRAYVGGGRSVVVYDIGDPRAPRELGRFEMPTLDGKVGWVVPAAARGARLYLVTGGGDTVLEATTTATRGALAGVAILDARDPAKVKLLGTSFLEGVMGGYRDATLVGQRTLAVADARFGLRVYDVGDAAEPKLVASDRRGGECSAIGIRGDTVYVGQNLSGGVWVVDASDRATPKAMGYLHTGMEIWGDIVPVGRDHIYFCGHARSGAGFWGGLHVADVRDPRRPKLVARLGGVDSYGMVRSGSHVFVGTGQILDASEPARPRVLAARLPVRARADGKAMAVVGDRLYFCAQEAAYFAILDISTPGEPKLVGECDLWKGMHRMNRIHVAGDTVLLSGGTNAEGHGPTIKKMGLAVPIPPDKDPFSKLTAIDVADETAPKLARTWTLGQLGFRRDWDDRINSVHAYRGALFVSQYSGWTHAYGWPAMAQRPAALDKIKASYWTWRTVGDGKWLYCVKLMGLDIIEIVPPPGSSGGAPR